MKVVGFASLTGLELVAAVLGLMHITSQACASKEKLTEIFIPVFIDCSTCLLIL